MTTEPGSKGVQIRISSKALDLTKIQQAFGNLISQNIVELDFRDGEPGEKLDQNNAGVPGSPGTYSLLWRSTEGSQCPEDAVGEGGTKINVNPGYWRKDMNSTKMMEGLNKDAGDGGFVEGENWPCLLYTSPQNPKTPKPLDGDDSLNT